MARSIVFALFMAAIASPALAQPQPGSPCAVNLDALKDELFVMAAVPSAGARVKSGFVVGGCSRTADGRIIWRVTLRSGKELATGNESGGGPEGPALFSFVVDLKVNAPTMAYLEVAERTGSGKGPVSRVIVPLILTP